MGYKKIILLSAIFILTSGFYVIDLCGDTRDDFKIAVFRERGFPYIGTPKYFTVEWLGNYLAERYDVVYLTCEELQKKEVLNTHDIDLLILPYGEAIAEEILPYVENFIKNGGGIFTTAGRPLGTVLSKEGGYWKIKEEGLAEKYLSSLGLYYYIIYGKDIHQISSMYNIWDLSFNMALPAGDQYGLCVKTSERLYDQPPTKGNVFPYRLPARAFMMPVVLADKDGDHIGSPLMFVKSWKNPYLTKEMTPNKWCLLGFKGENHPLNPDSTGSLRRLDDIIEFLSTKIIITGLETDYACYREGEDIRISASVLNYGEEAESVELTFYISEGSNVLLENNKKFLIDAKEKKDIDIVWSEDKLEDDFYQIKAVLSLADKAIDEEKNGFTVWHAERLGDFKKLGVDGRRFYIDEEPIYLYGINYYESTLGELLWVKPNIFNIQKDLKKMSDSGINFLRIHYHPPKWFRDYFEAIRMPLPQYFDDTVNTVLPDERSLRVLDAFIVLCQRYDIYFQPDIFTLVPKEMGDPSGWIGDLERCRDDRKIKSQMQFARLLSQRYRGIPNITWDLWNEPFLGQEHKDSLKEWTKEMVDCFRDSGDDHLITLGSDESTYLADEIDFLCGHGHYVDVPISSKPFLMQEIWNESDLTSDRESYQADKLKSDFYDCISQGGAGFVPWQWTRQSRLWDDVSDPERWDNELGLCVREDGSMKPGGRAYRQLIRGR